MYQKKSAPKAIAFVLCAILVCAALASCGLRAYDNDLRYRYDYDLTDYLKAGKYEGVEVYVGNTNVTQAEIDAAAARNLTGMDLEDVFDRPCRKGDIVGISYQGYLRGDSGEFDVPIEELSKGFSHGEPVDEPDAIVEMGSSYYYAIVLGCDELFPGFESQIIDKMTVGDREKLTYTLPEPCWSYPDLSGKEVQMDILLLYIQGSTPVDGDTYAAESGYGTYEDYRTYLGSQLIKQRTEQLQTYVRTKAWEQINENFTVKQYPEKELTETSEALLEQYKALAERKKVTLEQYYTDYLGLTEDQFTDRVKSEAEASVKDEMIVYYIARKNQIGVSNLDFESYVEDNYVDSGDYTSIEQYVIYVAVQNGFVESYLDMTDEIYEKAKNEIKQVILFNKVDELIDEKTVQKTEK